MADFVAALKKDLVEQFKGKPNIEALMEVISIELQQVYDFYEQLRENRDVLSAVGKQLDGVGDIVVLTRMEAGILAGGSIPFEVISDDMYRQYLIFKILKNTCSCTYPDIIKAFKMFWDKPLYYSEDPEYPATMFLKTGVLSPEDHAENLLTAPIIKAAGVGVHITATTESPPVDADLNITPVPGRGMAITTLPELEPDTPAVGLYVTPVIGHGMSITVLPPIEPDLGVAAVAARVTAASVGSIMETRLPTLPEFDTVIPAAAVGRLYITPHGSIMETKLPELKEENYEPDD